MINLNDNKRKLQFALIGVIIIALLVLIIPILLLKPNNKVSNPATTPNPVVEKLIPPQNQTENLPQDIKTKKQKIIDAKVKTDNGDYIIYDSSDYKIVYVPSRQIFFVTINKDPVTQNRESAQAWFKKFNLSQKDLCNLPVRLLVDFSLKKNNPTFNPLPDGCK